MNLRALIKQSTHTFKNNLKLFGLLFLFLISALGLLFAITQTASTIILNTNSHALSNESRYDGSLAVGQFRSKEDKDQDYYQFSDEFMDYLANDLNKKIELYNNSETDLLLVEIKKDNNEFWDELFKNYGFLSQLQEFEQYAQLFRYYPKYLGNIVYSNVESFLKIKYKDMKFGLDNFSSTKFVSTQNNNRKTFTGFGSLVNNMYTSSNNSIKKDNKYTEDLKYIPVYIPKYSMLKFNLNVNDTFEMSSSKFFKDPIPVKNAGIGETGYLSFGGNLKTNAGFVIDSEDIIKYFIDNNKIPYLLSVENHKLNINTNIYKKTNYTDLSNLISSSNLLKNPEDSWKVIWGPNMPFYEEFSKSVIMYWTVMGVMFLLVFILIIIVGSFLIKELLNKLQKTITVLSNMGMDNKELAFIATISCLVPLLISLIVSIPMTFMFTKIIASQIQQEIVYWISSFKFTWVTILLIVLMFILINLYFYITSFIFIRKNVRINSFNKPTKIEIFTKKIWFSKTVAYKSMFGKNFSKSFASFIVITIASTITLFSIGFTSSSLKTTEKLEFENKPYTEESILKQYLFWDKQLKNPNIRYKNELLEAAELTEIKLKIDEDGKISIGNYVSKIDSIDNDISNYYISKKSTRLFTLEACRDISEDNNPKLKELAQKICEYNNILSSVYSSQEGFNITINSIYKPDTNNVLPFIAQSTSGFYSKQKKTGYAEWVNFRSYEQDLFKDEYEDLVLDENLRSTVYVNTSDNKKDWYSMLMQYSNIKTEDSKIIKLKEVPVIPVVIPKSYKSIYPKGSVGRINYYLWENEKQTDHIVIPIFFKVIDYHYLISSDEFYTETKYLKSVFKEFTKKFCVTDFKDEQTKQRYKNLSENIDVLLEPNSFKTDLKIPYFYQNVPVQMKWDKNKYEVVNFWSKDYSIILKEYKNTIGQYIKLVKSISITFIFIQISLVLILINLIVIDNKKTISIFKLLGYGKRKVTFFTLTPTIFFILLTWPVSLAASFGVSKFVFKVMENQMNIFMYFDFNFWFALTGFFIAGTIIIATSFIMWIYLLKIVPASVNQE